MPAENETTPRWVFRVEVQDRPGAMTSIASAFSNEGINLDTIAAHGAPSHVETTGTVVVTFHATEDDQEKMARKVKRLVKVLRLEMHPYTSTFVRKSALIVTSRPLDSNEIPVGITHEPLPTSQDQHAYFMTGAPSTLDALMDRLEESNTIQDLVYTVLAM